MSVAEQTKTLLGSDVQYSRSYEQSASIASVDYFKGRIVEVTKRFDFEAGHFIPGHPKRCQYVHGHSYKLYVTVSGPINSEGVVIDFNDLNSIVNEQIDKLDHGFLNDIYEKPTAEIMAVDFMETIESCLKDNYYELHCEEIKLYETAKCCATVRRKRCGCDG